MPVPHPTSFLRRHSLKVLLFCGAATLAAQEDALRDFDLPAGEAKVTLKRFAQQAQREIMFQYESMKGVETRPVHGRYTVDDALHQMIAGTPLRATADRRSGAYAIVYSEPDQHAPAPTPSREDPKKSSNNPEKTMSPNATNRNRWLSGFTSLLLGVSSEMAAQVPPATPAPDVVTLPRFTVTESAADRYRPTQMNSVNRVASDILSAPFSVNVITNDFMKDVGAASMFDAAQYFAGVSPGRGSGVGGFQDRMNFRGFENLTRTIDNFSGSILHITNQGIFAQADPAFAERAELVMGPNTILSPTGTPGGSINVVTKSPKFERGTDLQLQVGHYGAQKIVVDTYGPFANSKRWAYRLVASAQDADTYLPGKIKQQNLLGAVEYDFSDRTKLVAKVILGNWATYGTTANAGSNGNQVSSPDSVRGATIANTPQPGFEYNGQNGGALWSVRPDKAYTWTAVFTTALTDHINMRLAGLYVKDDLGPQYSTFYSSSPATTVDPATGQIVSVAPVDTSRIAVQAYWANQKQHGTQLQNDFAANYTVGSVELQPVIGWSLQFASNPLFYSVLNRSIPTVNLAVNDTLPSVPPLSSFTTFSYNTPSRYRHGQAYAVLRSSFLKDRLIVTAGAARSWLKADVYVYSGVQLPDGSYVGVRPDQPNYLRHNTVSNTGSALVPSESPTKDTYLTGVTFKPVEWLSLYGSGSRNAAVATGNNPIWSTGTQVEFGAKAEFFERRLMLSLAHFDISQSNISTVNPLFNLGQSTIPFLMSDVTSKGTEFNVMGGITKNLSVVGSYTDMKYRDPLNRRIRNVPDTMWTLLFNYRFPKESPLKNLNLMASALHLGQVAGETQTGATAQGIPIQPGFYLAPWTVYNVGAGYKIGRFSFVLNVDNVTNKKFWWQTSSRSSVSPYPELNYRLTANIHF